MAKGYDRDLSFMLIEIAGDSLYFQCISRTGETIDSGRITKKLRQDSERAPTLDAPFLQTQRPNPARPENRQP